MNCKWIKLIIAASMAIQLALPAAASDNKAALQGAEVPLSKALRAKYDEMESLLAARASAEAVAKAMYWPNLVIAGEGVPDYYRDLKSFMPMLGEFVKQWKDENRDCKFVVHDPVVQSGDVAVVYTMETCTAVGKEIENYRVIYVWEKRGKEWKVSREQFSAGAIPPR